MKRETSVFILPQIDACFWIGYLPIISDTIRRENITKIICCNSYSIILFKDYLAGEENLELDISYELIESDINFEWTSTWLQGSILIYQYLKDKLKLKNVFYLVHGGDSFYALKAKRIGFALDEVNFSLIKTTDSSLESKLHLDIYPEGIHDIALSDIETYIIKYSDVEISHSIKYVQSQCNTPKSLLVIMPTIESTAFNILIKAIRKSIVDTKKVFDLKIVTVKDSKESILADKLKKEFCSPRVKLDFLTVEQLLKTGIQRKGIQDKVDLVFASVESCLNLAYFLLPETPRLMMNFSPLSKECNGYNTLKSLCDIISAEDAIVKVLNTNLERTLIKNNFPCLREITSDPLVSVCLTHYERPDYLKVALRSIINQTYENTEIIVSDDGSASPQTLEVLKSIDENGFLGREIIVSYGDNSYLGTSRNRARLRASGEYILYMDDDNLAKENEIEAFVRIAQKNDADFVGSFMNVFHSNEPEPDLSSCNSLWGGLGEIHSGYYLENYFSDANGLYKRSSLDKLGGYSTEYGLGYEDWELFHRMKDEGMRIIVLPEAFYFYRVNTDDSMVKTVSDKESLLRVLRHSSNRENYVKDLLISGMLRTFPY